jgi:hypothetical protein
MDCFAQAHLAIGTADDPPFALLAEELALEPVELALQRGELAAQVRILLF